MNYQEKYHKYLLKNNKKNITFDVTINYPVNFRHIKYKKNTYYYLEITMETIIIFVQRILNILI